MQLLHGATGAAADHRDPASATPLRIHEQQQFGFRARTAWCSSSKSREILLPKLRMSATDSDEAHEDADEHFPSSFSSPNGAFMSMDRSPENANEHSSKVSATSGLFRSPISGGVESATSSLDLPRPALAVRNLMEQARFAHLCTIMSRMHHRRMGYPFGTLVDFAADAAGHPIFSLSPLEIHTRNLQADPRCTLVVQVPGFSGLGNARATLFGDVYPLPAEKQDWAHKQYMKKHQQGASQQWGNFYYYQMQRISDILFVGGFGTVAWVDVHEYEAAQPDIIASDGDEETLKALNAIFSRPLREMLSAEADTDIDEAAVISIDSKGIDIRVRQGSKRLPFDGGHPVETLDEAKDALDKLIKKRTSGV